MLDLLITVLVAATTGAIAARRALSHVGKTPTAPDDHAPLDAWIAEDIMRTARAYAAAHGSPEVADLVARKLLLAHRYGRLRPPEDRS